MSRPNLALLSSLVAMSLPADEHVPDVPPPVPPELRRRAAEKHTMFATRYGRRLAADKIPNAVATPPVDTNPTGRAAKRRAKRGKQ